MNRRRACCRRRYRTCHRVAAKTSERLLAGEDSANAWWRELLALLNLESTPIRSEAQAAVADLPVRL